MSKKMTALPLLAMERGMTTGPSRRFRGSFTPSCLGWLGWLGCLVAVPALAQGLATQSFTAPGIYSYVVPVGTAALQVVVRGAAGGAGGWDDARGGDGAGGSIVSATITVKGGETVSLVVGEGGEGALAPPKRARPPRVDPFGSGGAGGGDGHSQRPGALTAALAGAGGRGGDASPTGSSPGGGGGGGASLLNVGGAAVLAAGGGAGGSNSRIFSGGNWSVVADSAVNALVLNQQDGACVAMAQGRAGGDGAAGSDGSGGGGGGGGYPGHAGAGGVNGLDGRTGRNSGAGGSGDSCTLDAGPYKVTRASISAGNATLADRVEKMVAQASGENGSITITAVAAAAPSPAPSGAQAVPVFDGMGWLLMACSLGGLGAALARHRKRQTS